MIKETINNTRKIKNIILAISAAATASPVNPKTPAITATIKKVSTHINIAVLLINRLSCQLRHDSGS
jgi:hypothetical protein